MGKVNRPINILEAIEKDYKSKEQQFLKVVKEMQEIAYQEWSESENEFGQAINQAMLTTIESIGKAFISIYKVKPLNNHSDGEA